jgi:hypothetical protein
MLILVAILSVSGLILLIARYGTISRNRWGINHAAVSCPNCHIPLTSTQNTRSLSQIMWGGFTCPACRTEVDKWGRKVLMGDNLHAPRNFWTKQRRISFDSLKSSPVSWIIVGILIILDVWWNLYHPLGFVVDAMVLPLACIFYRKYRKERNHTST